jgi:3-hydroxyisobutyrate dehydrogenase-like beta-hydroxyacid dehydrogenase
MAARLLGAGYGVALWNRTAARGRDLAGRGARQGATPADGARGAAILVSMLADPRAVGEALFGENGAVAALEAGATVIDCSTVAPADSRRFAERCAERGVRFVDAPVLGSVPAAEQGTLTILTGGEPSTLDTVTPVLSTLGKEIIRAGGVGQGSALKLVMNLLVGGLTELLAESFVLAERAGLEKETIRRTLAGSVLNSPFIGYKGAQLLDRQFSPLFTTRLMLKDLDLVLALAGETGATLPTTRAVRDLFASAAAAGRAEEDFSSVIEELDSRSRAEPRR